MNRVMILTAAAALYFSITPVVNAASIPITQDADFFAIIKMVDGANLTIEPVNSVLSRDGENWLRIDDQILATIEPLVPGNTRVAVCVKSIRHEGAATLVNEGHPYPREGCLGQLHDYEGAVGLPVSEIKIGTPVRIFLNGDLILPKP